MYVYGKEHHIPGKLYRDAGRCLWAECDLLIYVTLISNYLHGIVEGPGVVVGGRLEQRQYGLPEAATQLSRQVLYQVLKSIYHKYYTNTTHTLHTHYILSQVLHLKHQISDRTFNNIRAHITSLRSTCNTSNLI